MKTKTRVKAGALSFNHTQTLVHFDGRGPVLEALQSKEE